MGGQSLLDRSLGPCYASAMPFRIAMLGDVVGPSGVQAIEQQMPQLRQRWQPDLVIANAENAHNGSGLTPSLYERLLVSGVDAMTLGDHVYRRSAITQVLETKSNIIRPANISRLAKGRPWMKLSVIRSGSNRDQPAIAVYVITVLGRVFSSLPANDPFETVESVLGQLPDLNPIVVVEVHAEATSEKRAMGYQFDGRVAAVIGTHTHVPTADAQILPRGTAYITDIGMCGPHDSILGRRVDRVLKHMTTGMHAPFDVAEGDPRLSGVVVDIDEGTRLAVGIERIEIPADLSKPPFRAATKT